MNDSEMEWPEARIFCSDDRCVRSRWSTNDGVAIDTIHIKYFLSFSDAGTNSTALSSGANSPQLQRYVLQAPIKQVTRKQDTIASPQYQVMPQMIFPPDKIRHFSLSYILFSLIYPGLSCIISLTVDFPSLMINNFWRTNFP